MSNPPTQPPIDPAEGNDLPDPVLAPRALAELRQAFAPSLEVSPEADARVLHAMNAHRRATAHRSGFWRGFQIAAVLALAASFMFFMQQRRERFTANSPFAGAVAAQKERENAKRESDRLLADASPAPAVSDLAAASTAASFASGKNVTILDVLNLARKAENSPTAFAKQSKFKPSGEVVSPFDEVNELAAQVVGCKPAQVPVLAARANDGLAADAMVGLNDAEARHDAPRAAAPPAAAAANPVGDTRILTFDIMLDVGSRSLAAFQIEVSMSAPDTARVTLMGVRGGDHPALQRQPLFDSRRVSKPGSHTTFTVANFDTGKDLPSGDVRVARIVLVVVGPGNPGVTARLVIAAGAEGVPIPAGLRVVERAPISGADLKHKQLEKAVEEAEALPPVK
ncbi:MAG: hypothetical protein KF805_13515 [Phycisphaeraceae bacterium]|nr:hypothetical protein [Phycisphaeraceae bacterium]